MCGKWSDGRMEGRTWATLYAKLCLPGHKNPLASPQPLWKVSITSVSLICRSLIVICIFVSGFSSIFGHLFSCTDRYMYWVHGWLDIYSTGWHFTFLINVKLTEIAWSMENACCSSEMFNTENPKINYIWIVWIRCKFTIDKVLPQSPTPSQKNSKTKTHSLHINLNKLKHIFMT